MTSSGSEPTAIENLNGTTNDSRDEVLSSWGVTKQEEPTNSEELFLKSEKSSLQRQQQMDISPAAPPHNDILDDVQITDSIPHESLTSNGKLLSINLFTEIK